MGKLKLKTYKKLKKEKKLSERLTYNIYIIIKHMKFSLLFNTRVDKIKKIYYNMLKEEQNKGYRSNHKHTSQAHIKKETREKKRKHTDKLP